MNDPRPNVSAANTPKAGAEVAIVETALQMLEDGLEPTTTALATRFPGCEAGVKTALKAIDNYKLHLRKHQDESAPGAGEDVLNSGAILGDFEIVSLIGRGAMGLVYRARQKSLGGREVALKVLPSWLVAKDPRFEERFRREAQLASTIHSPHLASVFGFGTSDGRTYFAMQLIEGRTLESVLKELARKVRLGERPNAEAAFVKDAVRLVRDIASALSVIHKEGLVHRDVKPSNILLEGSGSDEREALKQRAVLVDFGLLRPVGATELTGDLTMLGTPAYAAPEACLGRDVDARADVFSLGAVLHDLLTLTRAGQRNLASAGLAKLAALNPAVDKRLAAIVEMALEERVALRYADGAAFEAELDRYLQNQPIQALPTSPLGRLRLFVKREPGRAARRGLLATSLLLPVVLSATWISLRISGLYTTASEAARLEASGDLLAARDAHAALIQDNSVAAMLPGLDDNLAHARAFADAFEEPLARLASSAEKEWQFAHVQLEQLFLPTGADKWDLAILRFLVLEIGQEPDPKRKLLALETAVSYLLINRLPLGESTGDPALDQTLEQLRDAMVATATESGEQAIEGQVEARRLATSAMANIASLDVFEALVRLLGDEDPEIRRLATAGTDHMWRWLHRHGQMHELTSELLALWAKETYESAQLFEEAKYVTRSGPMELNLLRIAWTRFAFPKGDEATPWLQGDPKLQPFFREVGAIFKTCSGNASEPPISPYLIAPLQLSSPIPINRRDFLDSNWPPTTDTDFFSNLFDPNTESMTASRRYAPTEAAVETELSFQTGPVVVTGGITEVSWEGASLEREGADGHLAFQRIGASSLHLRALIPEGLQGARISIFHCKAMRAFLANNGRASIQISVQGGPTLLECDVALGDSWLHFYIDQSHFVDRDELDLEINLAAGTTTYRIKRVLINFGLPNRE